MIRWSAPLTVAVVAAGLALAACTGSADNTPPASVSPTPTPTPVTVDAAARAATAAAGYLKENGYQVIGVTGATLKYRDEGAAYTSKTSCEGGPTHRIGWSGVCTAPSDEAISVVVVVSITTGAAGPKVTTTAMDEDTAAYCGDETTPAPVKVTLQKAAGQYCYLKAEDG